ncbi:MAG: hypothetical protein ATN32_08610 [Candidatus Epulonipiscium fishelsonii]|nr:MAG: hypothetical protein ATN32_08610 [Epulopiscium sp. AS2M-Bin002]
MHREITLVMFVAYMIGMFSQTIIPKWEIIDGSIFFDLRTDYIRINLEPFKTIRNYLRSSNLSVERFIISTFNILGNTILFSPFGFFFALLWKKLDYFMVEILMGFLITFGIESLQIFLNRAVDIDDLILNTVGIVFGYIIFRILKIFKKWYKLVEKIRYIG